MTEKDDRIEHLENDLRMCVQEKDKQIAELVQRIAELETECENLQATELIETAKLRIRNAEVELSKEILEGELLDLAELVNKHRKDRMIVDKKAAWACAEEILRRMK